MATRRLLLLSTTPHAVLAQLPPAEFAALFLFSSISAMPGDLTGNRIKHHRRDKRNSPGWEKQEALEVGMAAYCTCMGRRPGMGRRPDARNLSGRDRHPPETSRNRLSPRYILYSNQHHDTTSYGAAKNRPKETKQEK
jgi:hypothetical protein